MALPATKDRPDGELAVFDQLLDSFFDWPLPAMRVRAVTAPMDIYERDGKYVLELATPGYDPQDINVEVSGATVTVSGQHKETIERKDVKYHRREMRRGAFARTVTLPQDVDAEAVSATIDKGMLKVELTPVKPIAPKKIEVKSA